MVANWNQREVMMFSTSIGREFCHSKGSITVIDVQNIFVIGNGDGGGHGWDVVMAVVIDGIRYGDSGSHGWDIMMAVVTDGIW